LDLTTDHIGAARACGCDLLPATEAQVQRLTMQRRVFRIDGQPFVATRGGGLLESHGTLIALIERHAAEAPSPGAGAEIAPTQDAAPTATPEVTGGTEPPTLALDAPGQDAAAPERKGRRAAAAKPRKARTPPPMSAQPNPDPAPAVEAADVPSEAADMLAGVEALQPAGRGARVVGRRRAGEPPTPRWAIAGKTRRGRLK
jgi:hypothetical protein